METAGKLVDDDELREAMKDSGIGTPATRAAIIERLIDVGYIERDGRALVATEKGLNVIRLLDGHALTSPGLTGDWEHRLGRIEHGEETRERFMHDIAEFARGTVAELDAKLKEVRIPRANLGPCPVCGQDIVENRKGFSCWSREDPGCGFVIWKSKAGKTLPMAVAKELIATGRTARPVTGFKGRSGKSFRARLALQQSRRGKWRVEFDEPWAREGAKPPEGDEPGGRRARRRRPRPTRRPRPPRRRRRRAPDSSRPRRRSASITTARALQPLAVAYAADSRPRSSDDHDADGDACWRAAMGARRPAALRAAVAALAAGLGAGSSATGRVARPGATSRPRTAAHSSRMAWKTRATVPPRPGAGSRSSATTSGAARPCRRRPGDVQLGAVDQLGDLTREDEVGFGVLGGQVELRHGVLRGRLLARE